MWLLATWTLLTVLRHQDPPYSPATELHINKVASMGSASAYLYLLPRMPWLMADLAYTLERDAAGRQARALGLDWSNEQWELRKRIYRLKSWFFPIAWRTVYVEMFRNPRLATQLSKARRVKAEIMAERSGRNQFALDNIDYLIESLERKLGPGY